jgi:hypothetical protein
MTRALDSTVPLRRTYVALHPKHLRYDVIARRRSSRCFSGSS